MYRAYEPYAACERWAGVKVAANILGLRDVSRNASAIRESRAEGLIAFHGTQGGNGIGDVADGVSTPVLLQVVMHFKRRNDIPGEEGNGLRTFFPKGNLANAYAVENALPELPSARCRLSENAMRTVQDRVDITANTRLAIPLVIDVVERKVIWCDLSLTKNPRWFNTVHANMKGITLSLRTMVDLKKPTLHDLLTLHIAARGERVEHPEEAGSIREIPLKSSIHLLLLCGRFR
ncbi:MAG: cytoplasmic protein [Chlorobi bacterium]|nr:cytoplasmic protein [Chlorobiota bacterium]